MERQELIVATNNCTHIKYSNLSQQRSQIMGFAALCILLFHIGTNLDIGGNWFFNIIKFLLDNGKIGVDIFLLVLVWEYIIHFKRIQSFSSILKE